MSLILPNLPNAASDVVAVYDADFNQVFTEARPMKAMVNESSKTMEHPVETGITITDHRIILPIEIELSMVLASDAYRSVYEQIKQLFLDATLLTVQTKAGTHQNMIIESLPRDESPDMFTAVAVGLRLKEVKFVTAKFGTLPEKSVSDKAQSSTVNRGEQQPTNPSGAAQNTLLQQGRDLFL